MKELIDLTKNLISFKTIQEDHGEIKKCFEFIEDYFSGLNLTIKRFEKNKKPSLVISNEDTKDFRIILSGHVDVVPARDVEFTPRLEEGKLYGRGAIDMKAPIVVMMAIMKELASEERNPSVALMITSDEEVGGRDGTQYLLNEGGYTSELAFVPDAGGDFMIVTKAKGPLWLKLKAHGKAAHGAKPFLGENAIDKLVVAYNKIRRDFINPQDAKDWRTSINFSKIRAGDVINKVPDYAEMFLDIRFTEKTTSADLIEEIKARLTEGIDLEVVLRGDMFFTPEDNPYVKNLKNVSEKHLGRKVEYYHDLGFTDARFFSAKGITTLVQKPVGGGNHSEGEWVDIKSLEQFYDILTDFIQNNV